MKEVTARCPGSCGELVQGLIGGKELLVSYPIDRYSQVTIRSNSSKRHMPVPHKKLYRAVLAALAYMGIPVCEMEGLEILRHSSLAEGKGLSSSTADIGAAVMATAAFFSRDLSAQDIARIALSIEPTDSILFEDLTLFDPLGGQVMTALGSVPPLKVLILEGMGCVDTMIFRKQRASVSNVDEAYALLCYSIKSKDYSGLGMAAVISARLHQPLLPKPFLDEIIDAALQAKAFGVNVAHSGTAVGIIMDEELDAKRIVEDLKQRRILEHYGRHYVVNMVKGGPFLI